MSMTHNVTFTKEQAWALEPDIQAVAGETLTITCTYRGAAAVASGSATAWYKRGKTEITATVFPSGSVTASGNTLTLKPLTAMVAGNRYVIVVTGTVDSADVKVKLFAVRCRGTKSKTII